MVAIRHSSYPRWNQLRTGPEITISCIFVAARRILAVGRGSVGRFEDVSGRNPAAQEEARGRAGRDRALAGRRAATPFVISGATSTTAETS